MRRGDLVTAALPDDFGKPRPALVVQSDLFANHITVTILPVTSTAVRAPLTRLPVEPSPENGLHGPSFVMIDKAMSVRTERLGAAFGRLDGADMVRVNRALALFLGIAS